MGEGFREYLEYWGLERPAFSLAPCPDTVFLSRQHAECLIRLKYSILSRKGGALLISEHAGDGKTAILGRLCRDLREELEENVHVAFIDHPTLTPIQMLQEISRQIGIEKPYRTKVRVLSALRERLTHLHEQGARCVVIVDEGQMLVQMPDLLQELRILLNFCLDDAFLLSFIFSGQRPLESILRASPEFWQRLPVRIFLGNLDLADTKHLIAHRLRVAGLPAERELFTRDAYERIYSFSEGCPRVICSISDLALVVGRSAGVRQIDVAEVVQAHADMEKHSSEAFHYYHFLSRGAEAKRTAVKAARRSRVEAAALRGGDAVPDEPVRARGTSPAHDLASPPSTPAAPRAPALGKAVQPPRVPRNSASGEVDGGGKAPGRTQVRDRLLSVLLRDQRRQVWRKRYLLSLGRFSGRFGPK
jgi:type II secretory pathway predicted ATPase ExeA